MISVIIPVFNGERHMAAAVQSVLNQSLPAGEILVIDDGSTDSTADLARSFGEAIRYIYQANGGVSAARNRGVEVSRGRFLGFVDHDDLWMPDKLEKQMAAFEREPGLDMVFGHAEQFFSEELDEAFKARIKLPAEPLPAYLAGAMLVRRDAFLRAGPFDPAISVGECLEWYGRAVDLGLRGNLLREVVYRRRIHRNNTMISQKHQHASYVRILKAALDRRRKRSAGTDDGSPTQVGDR